MGLGGFWVSMADLSLLVNLASVEFVFSMNQSQLGFNRSGGSPVSEWWITSLGTTNDRLISISKAFRFILGISLPFCMHSW